VRCSVDADAAYQGAPGAFSEDAARALLGPTARLLPCRTLAEVFAALADGQVDSAVVPLANSLVGAVPGATELMVQYQARVVADHHQPVEQAVIGVGGARMDDVRHLWSHPVALDQCTQFLARHPRIEPRPAFDTAGAVAEVVARGEVAHAALGSRRAASVYGGVVLADAVQDQRDNVTRFVLLRLASPAGVPQPRR
jgi:prephenate dehydratase